MFIIRPYLETDLEDVIALWEVCDLTRPWNNPEIDIFRKTAQKDGLFLLAVKDEQLIATLMGGYDGHRGWINYLAVHPHFQRNGVATRGARRRGRATDRDRARGAPGQRRAGDPRRGDHRVDRRGC